LNARELLTGRQSDKLEETSPARRLSVQAVKIHQEILDLDAELRVAKDMDLRTRLVQRIYILRDLEESIRRKLR
jgi:hypothetical protein